MNVDFGNDSNQNADNQSNGNKQTGPFPVDLLGRLWCIVFFKRIFRKIFIYLRKRLGVFGYFFRLCVRIKFIQGNGIFFKLNIAFFHTERLLYL